MSDLGIRVLVLAALVAVAGAAGLIVRARAGRARPVSGGELLTGADLGGPLGERATFVQFSSPACRPCRAVNRVLSGVTAQEPGLGHVEIDATERLDLARRLNILRTPTVLVLDPAGRVVTRISGPLDEAQARAAVVPLSIGS